MKRDNLDGRSLNFYIQDLMYDNRCKEAIKCCDDYLKYYGKDNEYTKSIKYFRAKSYRLIGEFEIAEAEFNELIKIKNPKSQAYLYSLVSLFFLYIHLYRFDDALNLLSEIYDNKQIIPEMDNIMASELVIRKQKNMSCNVKKHINSYTRNQIMKYDDNNLYKHLLTNHMDESINEKDQKNHSIFNKNINLSYLINYVKDNLSNSVRANEEDGFDIYYFAISNVGTNYEDNCNFIRVVVIPGTNNILTMYPTNVIKGEYNIINCEYDKLYKEENKVKTLSRADKFKKRYNM